VPDLLDFDQEGWLTLLDLFDHVPRHWALVGGQMIHLHCWQRGRPAPRVTTDADLIMDIRAKRTVLTTVTAFLQDRGFREDGRSPTNVGHRWRRDRLSFDVLLPEGLSQAGARTSTVTGARTLQVPGGTQAIDRAQSIEVDVAGRVGRIIRPSLLGALVGKAAALEIPVDPNADRHSSDFITLASFIDNPAGMNALVTRRDAQPTPRIRPRLAGLRNGTHCTRHSDHGLRPGRDLTRARSVQQWVQSGRPTKHRTKRRAKHSNVKDGISLEVIRHNRV